MKSLYTNQIIQGDAHQKLQTFPANLFQSCVTSPPYYGQRNYGRVPGQIGLETTPELYMARLVEVFRAVRRVLRPDGTLWLNLGDCYVNKELLGLPWRVALALQADGWFLRADCIWHKLKPNPENVADRPTRAHEYVFLLSKSARYYYNANAIREPQKDYGSAEDLRKRIGRKSYHEGNADPRGGGLRGKGGFQEWTPHPRGRNRRSVWSIPTQTLRGTNHFAMMPLALAEICVLAGTSPYACQVCSAPWLEEENETWKPSCACKTDVSPGRCRVLDPFMGIGTSALAALRHGRDYFGIELNPDSIEQARLRLAKVQPELWLR